MGTTAQKLQAIQNSKAAIKSAIEAKGVSDVGDVLADYATKIGEISGGGSSGDPRYEVSEQGALTKKSFAVNYFNDLTSIPNYGLYYAYNRSNVTSASFPNVTSVVQYGMYCAFYQCTSLTSIDLSKVTSVGQYGMYCAFYGCTSLTSIDLSKVNNIGGTYRFDQLCGGCTSLISADLSSVPAVEGYGLYAAFQNCSSLQNVYLSKLSAVGGSGLDYAFQNCTHLELVDFSEATAVPSLSNVNAFQNTNNYYRIVVPNALYNTWIAATNWSNANIVTHIEKAIKALSFKAGSANSTISLDAVGTPTSIDIEYSTDGGATFSPYTVGTTITLSSVDDTVLFRAGSTGQTALADDSSNYHKFVMTGSITLEDDVSYLLSRSRVPSTTALADYAFYGLFKGCAALQNAPELPWTTMGEGCYGHMFEGCTALTDAPDLPSTSLDDYCYQGMFKGCTSITEALTLPATTLATGCYNEMFYGCSSVDTITLYYTGNFSTAYFNDWVYGVAASGTFYYRGSDTTTGTSAIPSGWTVSSIIYKNYINTNIAEMNTGVAPTTSTRVVGRFRGSAVGNLFVGTSNWRGFNSQNTFYLDVPGGRLQASGWDVAAWYDVEYGNHYFTCVPVNGGTTLSKTSTAKTYTVTAPLILGSATYQWAGEYEKFDCAGFKIYENDVLVKDYRPAVDGSGVACFYEEVSGTYAYPSSGTFLAY